MKVLIHVGPKSLYERAPSSFDVVFSQPWLQLGLTIQMVGYVWREMPNERPDGFFMMIFKGDLARSGGYSKRLLDNAQFCCHGFSRKN